MHFRITVLLITLISCAGNDSREKQKSSIEKKWRFQSVTASDFLTETSMGSTLSGMTIRFDSTKYSINSKMGLQRGRWRLIENNTKIELTDPALRIEVFSIEKLDESKLHLKLGGEGFFILICFLAD